MSGHAVMIMDGNHMVVSRFGVSTDKVVSTVEELQASPEVVALAREGVPPALRVLVDGRDMSDVITPAPRAESTQQQPVKAPTASGAKADPDTELKTAELAHHMLWESFKRSCQVQSYMLDKMTGCAVEMNRRFVQELETMRGNYTQALEKIDGMQFEQRMLEHEAASRHLSNHYVRLAEEDHRAAERRRDDERSVLEQLARGVMRVVDVIGSDSINGKN